MNGPQTHPVYKILKDQQPQDLPNGLMIPGEKGRITWNYTSKIQIISYGTPMLGLFVTSSFALEYLCSLCYSWHSGRQAEQSAHVLP